MHHRLLLGFIAVLLTVAACPAAGQATVDPPSVYELPPTRPQGPVVLDVPYEAMPPAEEELFLPNAGFPDDFVDLWAPKPWFWQMLPNNLIYSSYLAGPKEPRIGSVMYYDTNPGVFEPNTFL